MILVSYFQLQDKILHNWSHLVTKIQTCFIVQSNGKLIISMPQQQKQIRTKYFETFYLQSQTCCKPGVNEHKTAENKYSRIIYLQCRERKLYIISYFYKSVIVWGIKVWSVSYHYPNLQWICTGAVFLPIYWDDNSTLWLRLGVSFEVLDIFYRYKWLNIPTIDLRIC
mgnify:FL=1